MLMIVMTNNHGLTKINIQQTISKIHDINVNFSFQAAHSPVWTGRSQNRSKNIPTSLL